MHLFCFTIYAKHTFTKTFILVFFVMFSFFKISAQSDAPAYPSAEKTTLQQVKNNPEKYSDIERMEVYLAYISGYMMSNMDTTYVLYREMAAYGQTIGDDHLTGTAYSSMAFMHDYAGRLDSNIYYLRKSLNYHGDKPRFIANSLGALGNAFGRINKLDSAKLLIDSSIYILTTEKDSALLANAYLQKADLYRRQNQYYSSLDYMIKSLQTSHKAWTAMKRANTYQMISDLYATIGDGDKAIEHASLALEICKEKGYRKFTSELQSKLGALYLKEGNVNKAEKYLLKSISYQKERGNHHQLINTYSYLCQLYLQNKEMGKSSLYLRKADSLYQRIQFDGDAALYYKTKGNFYYETNNNKSAASAYNQLLDISDSLQISMMKISAWQGLENVYRKEGNLAKAYTYTDQIKNLKNEININDQKDLIYDLESKYETNLKNAEIQKLNAQQEVKELIINAQRKRLWFFGSGILLALLALWALYKRFSDNRKSNKVLAIKNNELQAALEMNKSLIKEIHHRVKNNLQVVSSLLNLQSRFEKDDQVLEAINTGKYRVKSMSILHQNLYKNEDLNQISVKKYFTDLIQSISNGYHKKNQEVVYHVEVDDITLDLDTLVPLGLIANELLTNALKYAKRDDEKLNISFKLTESAGKITMQTSDNGTGMPFTEIDPAIDSMGMQLILSFVHKLKADIKIINDNGAHIMITFVKPDIKTSIKALPNVAG